MKQANQKTSVVMLIVSVLALGACGGAGDNTGPDTISPIDQDGDEIAATLENLNVDTTPEKRVDDKNTPMPDSFTPVGKNRTLAKKSEMFLAGLGLTSSADHVNILKFQPGVSNVPGVPDSPDEMTKLPITALATEWKNDAYNDAASGDIDGDGFEEVVMLWWDSINSNSVKLTIIDDESEGFIESTTSVLVTAETTWLRVLTGDYNGDGTDEIAVAIINDHAGQVDLVFLSGDKTSGYGIDATLSKTFFATQANSTLGIELAAGQLDLDAGEEIAIVINEIWGSGTNQSPGFGTSYYYLYDDMASNMDELHSGRISGDIGTNTHNAVTGTVALGDVDGDGRDEIVLAGLADRFPIRCDAPKSIQFVLDDATTNFVSLGIDLGEEQTTGGGCESSANNSHIEHVWANTLDIDGDQYAEVMVNGIVYEDFANASSPWQPMYVDTGRTNPVIAKIPFEYIYVAKSRSGHNGRSNTTITVADVTADGREDILVYSPQRVDIGDLRQGNTTYDERAYAVTVWGIDPLTGRWGKEDVTGSEGYIGMLYFEELTVGDSSVAAGGPPLIIPVNVDSDSTVLKFSEGSHEIVFSEPLVHAVLAAPPCYDDGTQITDECRTAWGQGNSTGMNASVAHEVSVKHHAGVAGGVSLPIVGEVGVELERTVGVSLKAEANFGYELTKTITYTTGAMEDTVVATVIPYDQYTYTILSHPVYPDLVGEEMVISLPRTPRTMQINREFYNDSLVGDGVRIDERVFSHVIGNVKSYPTRSDMLAAQTGLIAKAVGPVDVGPSSGATNVAIDESNSAGFTTTIGVSYETSVKATGGKVMRGFTVGSTTEASLGFSVGSIVSFSGTVGDMPAQSFSLDKAYSYGLFAYKQDPGSIQRPFQVVNYWVE